MPDEKVETGSKFPELILPKCRPKNTSVSTKRYALAISVIIDAQDLVQSGEESSSFIVMSRGIRNRKAVGREEAKLIHPAQSLTKPKAYLSLHGNQETTRPKTKHCLFAHKSKSISSKTRSTINTVIRQHECFTCSIVEISE
jgi:hypothetical protein